MKELSRCINVLGSSDYVLSLTTCTDAEIRAALKRAAKRKEAR